MSSTAEQKRGLPLLLLLLVLFLLALTPSGYSQLLLFFGKVVDSKMNPVAGAEVAVFSGNLLVTSSKTGGDGSFNLRVPPGTYTMRVYLRGYRPQQTLLVASQEMAGSLGTIVLEPAVDLYAETTRLTVNQGDFLNISLRVVNRGLDPLQVAFTLEAPRGWTAYIALPGGLRVGNVIVNAGLNQTVFLGVHVPLDAIGENTIRVTASWENMTREIVFYFSVVGKRWTTIEFPASRVNAYPGAQLRIPFRVSNPFPVDVEVTFSQSIPQEWIAAVVDSSGLTVSGVALKAKESRQLFLILYVSPRSQTGTYNVSLFSDIPGLGRYTSSLTVIVESRYDLLNLTVGAARLNVTGGSVLSIPVFVRNDGNMPTLALIRVSTSSQGPSFKLSTTGQDTATVYVPPGEVKHVNLVLEATPQVTPGSYEVRVSVNGTTSYSEKVLIVNVSGTRRLVILNENFLLSATPGSAAVFRVRVSNTGTYPLSTVKIRFNAVPPGFAASSQPEVLSLLPGEEKYFDLRVLTPSDARDGVYEVLFTVEGDGLEETRILVVWVQREASLSFTLIMAALVVISFLLVFYGRRRSA